MTWRMRRLWRAEPTARPARAEGLGPTPDALRGRLERGRASERLAAAWLGRQGYRMEAANIRYPIGELDLVAIADGVLCIIEVRSQVGGRFGPAAASIGPRKRQHVVRAAQWYLQQRRVPWTGNVRFDVVAIDYRSADEAPRIELIRNAFTADR